MKTIFNEADRNEILQRIEKLTPDTKALWGKMTVAQMLAHAAMAAKIPTGEFKPKLGPIRFLGQLFKKFVLSEKPFGKNAPTAPELKMTVLKDFKTEKTNLIHAIKNLKEDTTIATTHPFLNTLNVQEWGRLNYKHADHHLKQFGV
jgi:hypothetical protein